MSKKPCVAVGDLVVLPHQLILLQYHVCYAPLQVLCRSTHSGGDYRCSTRTQTFPLTNGALLWIVLFLLVWERCGKLW